MKSGNSGMALIAGGRNGDDIFVIPASDQNHVTPPIFPVDGANQICRICGDEIERLEDNELFVACNECAFPVCRTCYEYERREGSQECPHCRTRYKRLKGSPRVEGDEEEDTCDDIEKEFNFDDQLQRKVCAESAAHKIPQPLNRGSIQLLTYGEEVDDIPSNQHALVRSEGQSYMHDSSLSSFGFGTIALKDQTGELRKIQMDKIEKCYADGGSVQDIIEYDVDDHSLPMFDEGRQLLSRKISIASSIINPYRMIIFLRLAVLSLFFHYRLTNPLPDSRGLWLTSVVCEFWFAFIWILDQLPKWCPITRETYLDRLSLRYEMDSKMPDLSDVDVFVTTTDPTKEPALIVANTVLSILALDYPTEKVSCYVSDDGASILTFQTLSETSAFATKWVPFCKKFGIEPRAPEWYFCQKVDYLKDKFHPDFVRERRSMKIEYEEFKVRVNRLVMCAQKVPEDGWTLQDATPWPGNDAQDHPGMIQIFHGHKGTIEEGDYKLPQLVYVSRERRPGYGYHGKAGAMNALLRASAVLSNAPYILNVDCDHYVNNSKSLREAMCFLMDPISSKKICYVQFPQRFDGIDRHDRYCNQNSVLFDVNMKGLDGIQGPTYLGSGCVFRRRALYGYDAPMKDKLPSKTCNCWPKWFCLCRRKKRKRQENQKQDKRCRQRESSSQVHALETIQEGKGVEYLSCAVLEKLERKFGQSPVFVASVLLENGGSVFASCAADRISEAIHVISCGYEDKTDWGKEIGWAYGSVAEGFLTGFKMHCHGWRSVYCMPKRPAFKALATDNLSDRLNQVSKCAVGSLEVFFSKQCPLWYGYNGTLKPLQRIYYVSSVIYPLSSIPLVIYCLLPAICLLSQKFIIPEISIYASLLFVALFASVAASWLFEMQWGKVDLDQLWRNEQFSVIGGVSADLFSVFQVLVNVISGMDVSFMHTPKRVRLQDGATQLYVVNWTNLLVPPMALLVVNVIGIVIGISSAVVGGSEPLRLLFCKLFFATWVVLHFYPFLKGIMGKQRLPTAVLLWSMLLVSMFIYFWARLDHFMLSFQLPDLEDCGLDCTR